MPEQIKTREHQWVRMTITPVEVIADERGRPRVFIDPEKEQGGEEGAQYGCFACMEGLEEYYGTECRGA